MRNDSKAVTWVCSEVPKVTATGPDLPDEEKRVILAVADLCGSGTGVAVDDSRLAEYADVHVLRLWEALRNLRRVGLLAGAEATMTGRLLLTLPIPGTVTVIKSDDKESHDG